VTEGRAILIAGTAHLALLAGLSLTWMQQSSFPSFSEAVPVEIVEVSDFARITEPPKPSIEAAPQETVEAAAPEIAPEAQAAPPEPEKPAPQPVSEVPAPEAPPKAEPKKEQAKPKPDAAAAAKKKAPQRVDAQELSALIDKSLPKAQRRPVDTSDFAKSIEKALPKGARLDARATATLEQAIRAQIAPCWNPPIGGEDVRKMTAVLRIQLDKTGRVVGTPELVSQTGVTADNQSYARAFAESARRAVLRCAPLELPAEYYDAWKLFELNFDPSLMT
jgi:outer membrane biosynthesis protein TonB